MSNIQITKVKLIKQGEKLEVAFRETGDLSSFTDKVCDNQVHADLKKSIDALACHLAIQTDYLTEKRAMDKEELEKFVVSGYSIGGKEEEEGVVITGYRKTRAGRTVTLNTPFLKLDSDPKTYYLIDNLNKCVEKIESETEKYLFEGKKAPEAQTSLDFGEEKPAKEKITKIKIEEPEEKKLTKGQASIVKMDEKTKKPKKKVAQTADAPSGEVAEG